jgi:hypothetical protein
MIGVSLLAILAILGGLYLYALLAPEKSPNRIFGPFIISPSGEDLAFRVGTLGPKEKFPSVEPKTCVLKLGKDGTQLIPVSRSLVPMAWRPGATPTELFGAVFSDGPSAPDRVSAVAVSDSVPTVFSQSLSDGLSVLAMAWNPSGRILAAKVSKVTEDSMVMYLGISYDNGKNINVTNISIWGRELVWTDNETLYVADGADILEVDVSDRNTPSTRTIVSAECPRLKGSLDGKVVYVLGNEIYCGEQLLYRSNQSINQIIADGSYVAFKAGSHIWVFDERGNVRNKKSIDPTTTKLIGISSVHKFVYLLKDLRCIQRYSFVDDDKITTVYAVTD